MHLLTRQSKNPTFHDPLNPHNKRSGNKAKSTPQDTRSFDDNGERSNEKLRSQKKTQILVRISSSREF